MKPVPRFRAVAAILLLPLAALAAGPEIGQVKTLSGTVTVARDGRQLSLRVGDAVFESDVIDTAADGAVGITFTDNTVMSAGPGSEVALAEYAFDSSNFTGSMLTDMRKGTLTMVSGDIARSSPGAMQVKTPSAMLGVRGTRFAISVPETGR